MRGMIEYSVLTSFLLVLVALVVCAVLLGVAIHYTREAKRIIAEALRVEERLQEAQRLRGEVDL
jgi:cell division protein FtsL